MTNTILGGFIINLMQYDNILRPQIYITADNIDIKPLILVTKSFVERDKSNMFINEMNDIAA